MLWRRRKKGETQAPDEAKSPPDSRPALRSKWRQLARFWIVVLVVLGGGGVGLQWLGPLHHGATPTNPFALATRAGPEPGFPTVPGTIPAPSADLLDPPSQPGARPLPRIAANGVMPARAYAAYVDRADAHPKVALLIASIGLSEADSLNAIRSLPAAVSLAISPYAPQLEHVLSEARTSGHETLISIPMESNGFPQNDAGAQSLLTGIDWSLNQDRLDWALSRISGYVGATALMGGLRGERFSDTEQMGFVLDELAHRGLIYLDPRPPTSRPAGPAQMRPGWRRADLVIDDPTTPEDIDTHLAALTDLAHRTGSAVGVIGTPSPLTVGHIAAWATSLPTTGVSLVPVSSLVPLPVPPQPASSPAARGSSASPEVTAP